MPHLHPVMLNAPLSAYKLIISEKYHHLTLDNFEKRLAAYCNLNYNFELLRLKNKIDIAYF